MRAEEKPEPVQVSVNRRVLEIIFDMLSGSSTDRPPPLYWSLLVQAVDQARFGADKVLDRVFFLSQILEQYGMGKAKLFRRMYPSPNIAPIVLRAIEK